MLAPVQLQPYRQIADRLAFALPEHDRFRIERPVPGGGDDRGESSGSEVKGHECGLDRRSELRREERSEECDAERFARRFLGAKPAHQ